MNPFTSRRRVARDLCRAGAALSAGMLVVSLVAAVGGREGSVSAAAVNAGTLTPEASSGPLAGQPITSGGSATAFSLTPPTGASCTGDSATGNYRVQSYMVPSSVNPATLTWGATGPIPAGTGAALRQPLFSSAGSPVLNRTTAVEATPGSGGLLTGLPAVSFGVFGAGGPTVVPAGTYNLGWACTVGSAGPTQLDRYWNVQLTFAVTPTDSPSGITWTLASAPPTTTTTVAPATSTTTTAPGATTSTAASDTSVLDTTPLDTTPLDTTPLDTTPADTATTVDLSAGGGFDDGSGGGTLVATGSDPLPILVWAFLLLAFGRAAILLARPLKVVPVRTS
jgi:hypothetical protein